MRTFYVCSYGGSGSTMLANAIKKYGHVFHIHSRNPPIKLEYVGNEKGGNTYREWFNGIEIPEYELEDYTVIFIYKNPIKAIYSRYIPYYKDCHKLHMNHVQIKETDLKDVIEQKKDLFGIIEFYNNYTTKNNERNYKIYCVRYEDIFEKQANLSEILGIGPLNLSKREKSKDYTHYVELAHIYSDLMDDMKKRSFVDII